MTLKAYLSIWCMVDIGISITVNMKGKGRKQLTFTDIVFTNRLRTINYSVLQSTRVITNVT